MLNSETRRKLQELNLSEMIDCLEIHEQQKITHDLSFEERFQLVVDYTYQEKYANKVKRLVKMAKFRFPQASVDDIYFTERNLDRNKIISLSTCQFVSSNTNLIFQGFTGAGKSFLACAIGKEACKQGFRTRYIRTPDLLQLHDEANVTVSGVSRLKKKFAAYPVLILDEWLMNDLTSLHEQFFFELIELRHTDASTIFCTQYKMDDWHMRLGGGVQADAIVDRIIHNKIQIYSGDLNMREVNSMRFE